MLPLELVEFGTIAKLKASETGALENRSRLINPLSLPEFIVRFLELPEPVGQP